MRETSPYSGSHYRPGDNYAICDECGLVYYASELKKRWDGALVCPKDWEIQHPQEFLKGKPERIGVKNSRPETYLAVLSDDCSSETGWTLGDGWTHDTVGYNFIHSSDVNALDRAVTGLETGTVYILEILAYGRTLGSVVVSLVTSADEAGDTTITTAEESNITFTAGATTDTIRFTPSTDYDGYIKWVGIYPYNASITASDL